MFVELIKKNILVYYFALFFESVAIAFPHAILTIIFLSKGIQIYEIALIQSMYSVAMVIFEFPSGVLADKYRKKYIFLVSDLFLIITYILVLRYNGMVILMFAWFLYGISSALKTGTLDSQIILLIRNSKDKQVSIERFIANQSKIASVSAIIGSGLGFFLYNITGVYIYFIMILSLIISFLIILIYFDGHYEFKETNKRSSLKLIVIDAFKEMKNNNTLKLIIIGLGIVQMYIQIHFQLWQSYFLSIGLDKKYFYIAYLIFQTTSFLVFSIKIEKCISKYLNYISIIFLFLIPIPLLYAGLIANLVTYLLIVIIVSMYSFYLNVTFNNIVKKSNISSITSLMSTIIRLFGFVVLSASAFIIKIYSINILFLAAQSLILIGLYFIIKKLIKQKAR